MKRVSRRLIVLQIGPHPESRGGVASVIATYMNNADRIHYTLKVVPTTLDRVSKFRKTIMVTTAIFRMLALSIRNRSRLILHIHTSSKLSFWRKSIFVWLGRLCAQATILHIHGGRFFDWYHESRQMQRRIIRLVLRRPDTIIVLARTWVDQIEVIADRDSIVLPNPVDPPVECGDCAREDSVLFAGRLSTEKGVFDLIQAIGILQAQGLYPIVVLAGEGDGVQVASQIQSIPAPECVITPGWMDKEQMDDLLARCMVFCLPSYVEGQPIALLDAMARGVPCIATDVGGIPDFAVNGVNCMLVKPGRPSEIAKALALLLRSPQARTRLGTAAQETVLGTFSVELIASTLTGLYQRIEHKPGR